jgi:hypothetical protein
MGLGMMLFSFEVMEQWGVGFEYNKLENRLPVRRSLPERTDRFPA